VHRKLTITVSDDVYRGLYRTVGRGSISRFIEDLVRPHVVGPHPLAAEYREAAAETEGERDALEWIEANLDDGWA
jgi:predicted CopG family antitoxin